MRSLLMPVLLSAGLLLSACSGGADTDDSVQSGVRPYSEYVYERLAVDDDLTKALIELRQKTGARVGIAFIDPDSSDNTVRSVGSIKVDQAWSTIKVPGSIATVRDARNKNFSLDPEKRRQLVDAITVSDNDAAAQIWNGLGTPSEAGRKVDEVLSDGGAVDTFVEWTPEKNGDPRTGSSSWSLNEQVVFVDNLPALEGSEYVWDLMGSIDDSQRWGLGRFPDAHFKGGWGDDETQVDEGYIVRQFGQIPLPDHAAREARAAGKRDYIPIAMAVRPEDGSFGSGIYLMDYLAKLISAEFGIDRVSPPLSEPTEDVESLVTLSGLKGIQR